jgi:amino acid permease
MEMTRMNSSPNRNTDIHARTSLTPREECSTDGRALVSSAYVDPSDNDLTTFQGAALIVADCMGTGILALPNNMKVLGFFGLFFLVINLPINYYAGDILHKVAKYVESRIHVTPGKNARERSGDEYNSVSLQGPASSNEGSDEWSYDDDSGSARIEMKQGTETHEDEHEDEDHHYYGIDTPHTSDFIGVTYALFDHFVIDRRTDENGNTSISTPTMLVTAVYYINIFLVLGNYILVMSHAVAAMLGEENICLPTAGVIASTLMFAISQLRTMAMLGRSASVISLLALAVVVVQCLTEIQMGNDRFSYENNQQEDANVENDTMWQSLVSQLAALSSIGFAVGSQKLFLNIRHEFADRDDSPRSLGIALFSFGAVYLLVCLLAGPDPPSLLFDAISSGPQRRIAGFLLWVHVSVSFAINSQALCSSLDRLKFHRVTIFGLGKRHKTRWAVLTFMVAISSYFIANAVPFFKDLVALIGALTSIPLTLLLPALFHRKVIDVPLFWIGSGSSSDIGSLSLVVFSVIFLVCGVVGSIFSIKMDWANHGPPFACH